MRFESHDNIPGLNEALFESQFFADYSMNFELFDFIDKASYEETIAPQALILHGFALPFIPALLKDLDKVIQAAPFRHMKTPGGFTMSIAMTNCGNFGWVSDASGYRYDLMDPLSAQPWPEMPDSFLKLALGAAERAGFSGFKPDACLINQYAPKSKLSLHQDKDEKNFDAPIVSISLGVPAVFLFGGLKRNEKKQRYLLEHGDAVVWGGTSRLCYHGILPLKQAYHPILGMHRINLTFRQAR